VLGRLPRYRWISQPHYNGARLTRASSSALSIFVSSGLTGFSCELISGVKARSDLAGGMANRA
jgi:hypothetical protein